MNTLSFSGDMPRQVATRISASYKVDLVPLFLTLPGSSVRPIGLLLLDVEADNLYCMIDPVSDDEDAAEILGFMANDFVSMAEEWGGSGVLAYLEKTLSNAVQTGGREQLAVPNHPAEALERLFSERIAPSVNSHTGAATKTCPAARKVLVVEDNPSDVWLIKGALQQYSPTTVVTIAADGEEALQLLDSFGAGTSEPDLVLLDINLPKLSGHEVLQRLRANPRFTTTPVAILSSSDYPRDMRQAYEEGANCYVRKAADLLAFNASVAAVCSRFFAAAA